MEEQEKQLNIHQKLVEIRKTVTYLQKENKGEQYKYVSSSQVLLAVREKMDELGVLLVPNITGHNLNLSAIEYRDKEGHITKRTTTYFTELDMSMIWVNVDNPSDVIICPWYGQGVDIAGEKGVGKATTYAEKYFMIRQFNIPTDQDDPDSIQHGPTAERYTPSSKRIMPETKGDTNMDAIAQASNERFPQTDGISQGQLNMLFAKSSAAGFKAEDKDKLTARVSDFLGYPVTDLKEVRKADVTKLAQYLDKLKKAS